jgi:hypothetical protein
LWQQTALLLTGSVCLTNLVELQLLSGMMLALRASAVQKRQRWKWQSALWGGTVTARTATAIRLQDV